MMKPATPRWALQIRQNGIEVSKMMTYTLPTHKNKSKKYGPKKVLKSMATRSYCHQQRKTCNVLIGVAIINQQSVEPAEDSAL